MCTLRCPSMPLTLPRTSPHTAVFAQIVVDVRIADPPETKRVCGPPKPLPYKPPLPPQVRRLPHPHLEPTSRRTAPAAAPRNPSPPAPATMAAQVVFERGLHLAPDGRWRVAGVVV